MEFAGSTSGAISVRAPATGGAANFVLPATAPGATQALFSDTSGNLSFDNAYTTAGDATTTFKNQTLKIVGSGSTTATATSSGGITTITVGTGAAGISSINVDTTAAQAFSPNTFTSVSQSFTYDLLSFDSTTTPGAGIGIPAVGTHYVGRKTYGGAGLPDFVFTTEHQQGPFTSQSTNTVPPPLVASTYTKPLYFYTFYLDRKMTFTSMSFGYQSTSLASTV